MDILTNQEQKGLDQTLTLLQSAASGTSYDHIELTEEELEVVIYQAKKKKAAKLAEIRYLESLQQPKQYQKFTYETYMNYLFEKHNIVYDHEEGKIEAFKQDRVKYYVLHKYNKEIFEMLCQYFTGDPAFEMQGDDFSLDKGILLFGGIGCGKTSLMKIFSINSHKPFCISPCMGIASEYTKTGEDCINKYGSLQPCYPQQNFGISNLGRCYDDIGTEDNKAHFANKANVIQSILFKVVNDDLIGEVHGTTNLTDENFLLFYGDRIHSRINEIFNIIEFDVDAPDRRKEKC